MTAAAARMGELMAGAEQEVPHDHDRRGSTRTAGRPTIAHDVRLTDAALRDGSHAMAHQFADCRYATPCARSTEPASR